MSAREQLRHHLRIHFALPPYHPNDQELSLVISDILALAKTRNPTEEDWEAATRKHVAGVGTYLTAGQDNSDLNSLLALIRNEER